MKKTYFVIDCSCPDCQTFRGILKKQECRIIFYKKDYYNFLKQVKDELKKGGKVILCDWVGILPQLDNLYDYYNIEEKDLGMSLEDIKSIDELKEKLIYFREFIYGAVAIGSSLYALDLRMVYQTFFESNIYMAIEEFKKDSDLMQHLYNFDSIETLCSPEEFQDFEDSKYESIFMYFSDLPS